jgi:RNA recognition motif-containing protein
MQATPDKPTPTYKTSDGSSILDFHNKRIKTAGRPGQRTFVDPCKLFIGNLPFDATEKDILRLFASYYHTTIEGVGERIESVKVIRDWKTGESKGYGFCMFYNAIDATTVMHFTRGGKFSIRGRPVRFDQGKKKDVDDDMRLKKKEKRKLKQQLEMGEEALDAEGRVIYSALESVEVDLQKKEEEVDRMSEDDMITFMEKGGLRGVMPLTEDLAGYLGQEGLYEDDDDDVNGYFDENSYDDVEFDDEDGDNENFEYDGVFEEMYNPDEYEDLSEEEAKKRVTMNREQRRAADKRRKKKKLPFKGFGKPN